MGISLDTSFGLVPDYEMREAAVYCNYNLTEWDSLTGDEKAFCVAQYRIHNLIDAHVNEAVRAHSETRG